MARRLPPQTIHSSAVPAPPQRLSASILVQVSVTLPFTQASFHIAAQQHRALQHLPHSTVDTIACQCTTGCQQILRGACASVGCSGVQRWLPAEPLNLLWLMFRVCRAAEGGDQGGQSLPLAAYSACAPSLVPIGHQQLVHGWQTHWPPILLTAACRRRRRRRRQVSLTRTCTRATTSQVVAMPRMVC